MQEEEYEILPIVDKNDIIVGSDFRSVIHKKNFFIDQFMY